ncbi:MAG: ATP-binding protein [Candidatus Wallbacteria bacterium]|nr:ATP-binding protein [Candidatus Wallbacteria bacterium]
MLQQKLLEGLTVAPPRLTRRDLRLPAVPNKALAVIGVRRSGKTTFLWQCLAALLAEGTPREALLFLGLEDDRLVGLETSDLSWLVEEYFRLQPGLRDARPATFFLDEIQLVPGWEAFARRLIDTERVRLFLSGSSARLLSREVASSMRGRALEVLVHPFSFRESLRHGGKEPDRPWTRLPKAARSVLDAELRQYLVRGGFPEVLGVDDRDRSLLLRSYVDVVVLRDVIERHSVSNPLPLRWLQRHLLANPASPFSVQKFYDALRSQGIPVGKDTLHAYLGHLEDAFLIRTVSMRSASERQRMVNPRKAYPVDPGLIPLFERTGRSNLGHALETVVFLELERRGYEVDYVRTREGFEVDFLATASGRPTLLIQACVEVDEQPVWEREIRALEAAALLFPEAVPLLLTLESQPPRRPLPNGFDWLAAAGWLLDAEPGAALAPALTPR